MIRINLDEKYFEDIKINEIYNDIAKNIFEEKSELGKNQLRIMDKSGREIKTEEEILEFLLAENFYEYSCDYKELNSEIIKILEDFNSLSTSVSAKSLLKNGHSKSLRVRKFYNEYDEGKQNYIDFENNIQSFIKGKNGNSKFEKLSEIFKEKFLEEKYNDYGDFFSEQKRIFNYGKITKEKRHDLISKMKIYVCPYCNMNYIINYKNIGENKIHATADWDHFYPKSRYPLYGLCLYNLIPSCQVCNSRMKLNADMNVDEYIYPYNDSYEGKANFEILNIIEVLNDNKSIAPEIILKNESKNSKIINSEKIFKNELRYKEFTIQANDIIEKVKGYNDFRCKELESLLEVGGVKDLVFGRCLTEEEMLNESLGKFKNDLLKQTGIF